MREGGRMFHSAPATILAAAKIKLEARAAGGA
jgi:hypothetical protein